METPEVAEKEIDEIITFLRSKGQSSYANRVIALKEIEQVGREQHEAGVKAILEVQEALTKPVPRDLILGRINKILEDIKKVM